MFSSRSASARRAWWDIGPARDTTIPRVMDRLRDDMNAQKQAAD